MTLGVITTGDATVNRRQRILLGIATAWPFAYGILFAVFAMPYLDAANAGSEAAKDYLIQKFIPAMLLPHTLALACLGSLVLYYIYYILKMPGVRAFSKIIWVFLLFFGHMLVIPVFWYLFIWRDSKKPAKPTTKRSL